ncbi:MAG: endonuclease/exonuclease/phosphatase family protein [Verrucomicrobiota bacterium]
MPFKFTALLLFLGASLVQAVGLRVATFNVGAHLVVPPGGGNVYFDYGIGPPGQPDFDTVRDILQRIDADVVALQEIHGADFNAGNLTALATGLGYPYVCYAPATNTFDTSLHVAFFSRFPFLSQILIGSPAGAKEMNRLIPAVKVDVPGTTRDPVLVAAHLKSGSEASDLFQRTIELRRLTNYLTAQGLASGDNFLVMGDFNLSSNPRTFASIPASGLPGSFSLGADITFPISYFTDPTLYFSNPSVTRILPRQLDNSTVTFPSSGSTIDVFLGSGIIGSRPLRTEIYNSALDTSNSAGLPKAGAPLAAGTSATASDHLPLFGDFELDPALPYTFNSPGETVNEAFPGFPGTYDPYPWTTTGGDWQGTDNGSATAPGFRSYGSAADPSLGFLPGTTGGSATASFVNHSAVTLTNLHISYTAEQWRSATGGTADTLSADLIVGGVPNPLPALTFHAATNLPAGAISGGASTPKSMLVSGLAVPPGGTFQIRFTFTPGAGNAPLPTDVFVNEFHYDNTGTDTGEFIEVVVGPGFSGNLSDIDVLLYRGVGTVYSTLNLGNSPFTLKNSVNGFKILVADLPVNGLQNGPSNGIAVVNKITNQLLHFLSYEGVVTATAGLPPGAPAGSTDIGFSQTGGEAIGYLALGLIGTGGVRTDFTWDKIAGLSSNGLPNTGQTFVLPTLPPQGIAIDNLAVTFIGDSDSDGDGMSDLDEYIFGSDPHNAASRYAVTITQTAADTLHLSFHRIAKNSYVLESSINLTAWSALQTYPAGFDSDTDVSVTITPGTPAKFFRVRALAP